MDNRDQTLLELLNEAVYQGLGEASMAWSETPTGVFQDQTCKRIGEEILATAYRLVQGELAWLASMDCESHTTNHVQMALDNYDRLLQETIPNGTSPVQTVDDEPDDDAGELAASDR